MLFQGKIDYDPTGNIDNSMTSSDYIYTLLLVGSFN